LKEVVSQGYYLLIADAQRLRDIITRDIQYIPIYNIHTVVSKKPVFPIHFRREVFYIMLVMNIIAYRVASKSTFELTGNSNLNFSTIKSLIDGLQIGVGYV